MPWSSSWMFFFIQKTLFRFNFFPPNSIFCFRDRCEQCFWLEYFTCRKTKYFQKILCKCHKITQINLHSYFQKHDTDGTTCAPGGLDGNYIMYAHATSGNLPNNNKFSSCSINQMAPIIENKCRTSTGCFIGKRTCLKTNLML